MSKHLINSQLIIIYLFLTLGYSITRGFFSFGAFTIILFALSLYLVFYFFPKLLTPKEDNNSYLLIIILILSILLSTSFYGGLYQQQNSFFHLSRFLLFSASVISFSYLLKSKHLVDFRKNRFLILLVIAILTQIFMIISSPKPTIDVFYQLKIGSQGLLYGQNPYSMSYPQIYDYPQDYFPYLPLTLLAVLPFNVLLSDPRYALVVANIISALVIYKLFDKKHSVEKEVLPLILLFNPQQTFMIEQSWIDPLIFTFFCLFIFSIEKKYSWITSTIFLTFVIGIKQIFLFILIFIYLYKKIQKKILVSALIISIFSILFFFLWNPQDFTNDVFLNHVNRINWWHNSLTLNSFVHAIFKINIPIYLFLILWTFALFGFLKIKAENLASLVLAITGFLFTFYVFNYQAYIHYYALVSNLMILSMTLNKNDGSA